MSAKKFRSIATWPKGVGICLGNTANESSDTHDSYEEAEAVCRLLKRHGFGGDGVVFPLLTRIEPVEPESGAPSSLRRPHHEALD